MNLKKIFNILRLQLKKKYEQLNKLSKILKATKIEYQKKFPKKINILKIASCNNNKSTNWLENRKKKYKKIEYVTDSESEIKIEIHLTILIMK